MCTREGQPEGGLDDELDEEHFQPAVAQDSKDVLLMLRRSSRCYSFALTSEMIMKLCSNNMLEDEYAQDD